LNAKQSFEEARYQAELGNEKKHRLAVVAAIDQVVTYIVSQLESAWRSWHRAGLSGVGKQRFQPENRLPCPCQGATTKMVKSRNFAGTQMKRVGCVNCHQFLLSQFLSPIPQATRSRCRSAHCRRYPRPWDRRPKSNRRRNCSSRACASNAARDRRRSRSR
jgi:hypothetical protein